MKEERRLEEDEKTIEAREMRRRRKDAYSQSSKGAQRIKEVQIYAKDQYGIRTYKQRLTRIESRKEQEHNKFQTLRRAMREAEAEMEAAMEQAVDNQV